MKKLLVFGVAGLLLGAAIVTALTQTVGQNAVSGNECWNAGQGPGGPSFGFLCVNQVRNGAANRIITGSGSATTTATQNDGTLTWHTTAPTTWTVTLPNPAFDGEILRLSTDTTLTTMVTVQAASSPQNQTLHASFASQTLTADTAVAWQFSLSLLQWVKIQ